MSRNMNEASTETVKAAIRDWCAAILAQSGKNAASVDELADHLHCEIERLMAEGLSADAAFATATEQMGNRELLVTEFAKNHTRLTKLRRAIQAVDTENGSAGSTTNLGLKKLMLIQLMLLAIVTFATQQVLAGTGYFLKVAVLIYALWLGSFLIFWGMHLPALTEKWVWLRRKPTHTLLVATVANLVLLATVTFTTGWMLDDTAYFNEISVLLFLLWSGSFSMFYGASEQSDQRDFDCLRQKVLTLLKRG